MWFAITNLTRRSVSLRSVASAILLGLTINITYTPNWRPAQNGLHDCNEMTVKAFLLPTEMKAIRPVVTNQGKTI